MADLTTLRLRITGRVQGVGYRDWTARTARSAGLAGWVRNRADGSVEAVVQGPPAIVETFVAACQAGPPSARVKAVEATPDTKLETGAPDPGFHQLPTV